MVDTYVEESIIEIQKAIQRRINQGYMVENISYSHCPGYIHHERCIVIYRKEDGNNA